MIGLTAAHAISDLVVDVNLLLLCTEAAYPKLRSYLNTIFSFTELAVMWMMVLMDGRCNADAVVIIYSSLLL